MESFLRVIFGVDLLTFFMLDLSLNFLTFLAGRTFRAFFWTVKHHVNWSLTEAIDVLRVVFMILKSVKWFSREPTLGRLLKNLAMSPWVPMGDGNPLTATDQETEAA